MTSTRYGRGTVTRIVVGVDGSEPSSEALDWALSLARITGAVVHVVQAWLAPVSYGYPDVTAFRGDVEHNLRLMVKRAEPADLAVTVELVDGAAAHVLVEASRDADLLVVGTRGYGGFTGLLLGSVSAQVVHHAACPVVVVPPTSVVEGRSPATERPAGLGHVHP